MGATVREQTGFVYVQALRRGDVRMRINNHWCLLCLYHRFLVTLPVLQALLENVPRFDPLLSLLVHFLCIRRENDPLARPEDPRVHHVVETRWEFLFVVMSVFLMMEVDVILCVLQRAEVFFHVLFVGIVSHDCRRHEGAIQDFAEAQLFGEVSASAKEGRYGYFMIDQQLETLENHAAKMKLDLLPLQNRIECLNGGVVAARLPAHSNRHISEIFRRPDTRIRSRVNARRGHRVSISPYPAVTRGRRHVYCPVTCRTDVAGAALLDGLISAADLVFRQFRGGLDREF